VVVRGDLYAGTITSGTATITTVSPSAIPAFSTIALILLAAASRLVGLIRPHC
jgi:hypothetical protein